MPASLALAGAGKMGGAMLAGWQALGLKGAGVCVIDPQPSPEMAALCATGGFALNPAAPPTPNVLVLAVKPQMLGAAAAGLEALAGPETLLISIIAGKTVANLQARFPRARAIVRCMPNTPAAVGRGVTGAFASPGLNAGHKSTANALLAAIGGVVWVEDEGLIDAVTAVSGSGPAYVFYLTECLAKAGEAQGLPADLAMRLARATVEGSGELMFRDPASQPETLRKNVTS